MANEFDPRYSDPRAVQLAKGLSAPRPERAAAPYRRATTPQSLAQNAFYPEDENRAGELERVKNDNWVNWYNENLGPQAIRKLSYDGAKQLGWDEQRANQYADHMQSKAVRGEHLMMDAPLAGAIMGVGTEAYNTARSVMTGTRAAESAAPHMLALPPPRPGPSSPIGRGLTGETIEAGRPPVNTATDFRVASEQGQRIGPNRPPEARNPVIDEMYDPNDLYLGREGSKLRVGPNPEAYKNGVVNRPLESMDDLIARLETESPGADLRLGEAGRNARATEAEFQANRLAAAENEGLGGARTQADKNFAQFQNELAAIEERGAGNQFTPPAVAGEPTSPLLSMPAPGVKRRLTPPAEPVPAQPTFESGVPQSVGGQMVNPLTGRAYMPRQFPQTAAQPVTGSLSPVTRAEAAIPQRAASTDEVVDLAKLLGEPRKSPVQGRPAAQSADNLIDQAIADATGDVSRQSAIDRAKQRLAAKTSSEAPAAARQAEPPLSAEEIASLRENGFDDLAAQLEAAQAQQGASAAVRPAAAAQGPSSMIRDPWGVAKSDTTGRVPNAGTKSVAWTDPSVDSRLIKGMENAAQIGIPSVVAYEIARQKMGQPSMYLPDPEAAAKAARERQAIDDTDDAALNAARSATNAQRRQIPAADADSITAGYDTDAERARNMLSVDDNDRMNDARAMAARRMLAIDEAAGRRMGPPSSAGTASNTGRASNAPTGAVATAPAGGGSWFDKIFSGPDSQSSGGLLIQQRNGKPLLNWGDSDSGVDFFRASAAAQKMREAGTDFTGLSGSDIEYRDRTAPVAEKRGGAVEQKPSKEAMLHKSLEIIHHMIRNR